MGKLEMGPVWDFDYKTFLMERTNEFSAYKSMYYERLFQDSVFVASVKDRWEQVRPKFDSVPYYIISKAQALKVSNSINLGLWPIKEKRHKGLITVALDYNSDEKLLYDDAVSRMVKAFRLKMSWLNNQIEAMHAGE